VKLSEYAARNGIRYRAAWNRHRAGMIEGAYLDDSGHVVVPDPPRCMPVSAPVSSATIWIVRRSG
jgi:putative resolvase